MNMRQNILRIKLLLVLFTILSFLTMPSNVFASDDIEVEGIVQAVESDNLTVQGIVFYVDANTEIENDDGDPIALSDIHVGNFVEVEGDIQADSTYLATEIELEHNNSGNEVRIEGLISDLGSNYLSISGTMFFVDNNTRIRDENENPLDFADLMIGDDAKVRAERQADSTLLATRIDLDDDNNSTEIEITAQIEDIFGDSLIVGGITFFIDANTRIEDDDDNPISFSDLQIGMLVEIEGYVKQDGTIRAKEIEIEGFFNDEFEIKGMIDSLGIDFLYVLDNRFDVSTNTIVLDDDNNLIAFSDLSTGLIVEVRADLQANGNWLATRIKIEDDNNNDFEVRALIDALSTNTIQAGGREFTVNGNTLVLDNFNHPISFSDLTVGLLVEIRGVFQTTNNLLAIKIKVEDSPNFSRISGNVTDISGSNIRVNQPEFVISPSVIVLNEFYQPITISDIAVGSNVTLWADNTSQPTAIQIQRNSGSPTGVKPNEEPLIDAFLLRQNYPNPFNPSTTIPVEINRAVDIELSVFNVLGQKVVTLHSGNLAPGSYRFQWSGSDANGFTVAGGVYYYQLIIDTQISSGKKMILLK
ncbi:MAG: DUF5666 domain-containing protein [Calditrichia bacterium]